MGSQWQRGPGLGMPVGVRMDLLARLRAGASWEQVQVEFGCSRHLVHTILREAGGMPPVWPCRSRFQLSLEDRETISRGIVVGESLAGIARQLRRPTSTVSREVRRHGGRESYRAARADREAFASAKRPKLSKFELCPALVMVVEDLLQSKWSPEQISGHLRLEFPDDDSMHVVPETIYQALFVQTRGGLNKELAKYLRTQRKRRKPRSGTKREAGQRSIVGKIMISQRPAEIEDRAVPGHWEGDLIIGANGKSQAGTLVERTSGLLMMIQLPTDRTAPTVAAALQRQIATLPERSCSTITWDQGIEMANHASFTIATGIAVYFCDPHAPWQRGSNENTNGLIRQYLPHGMDLSNLSQPDLDYIADEINNRPRKRHRFRSPLYIFNQLALQ